MAGGDGDFANVMDGADCLRERKRTVPSLGEFRMRSDTPGARAMPRPGPLAGAPKIYNRNDQQKLSREKPAPFPTTLNRPNLYYLHLKTSEKRPT